MRVRVYTRVSYSRIHGRISPETLVYSLGFAALERGCIIPLSILRGSKVQVGNRPE